MDEQQWISSNDTVKMLEHIRGKISDRKLKLFACACCRDFTQRNQNPDPNFNLAIDELEKQADDLSFDTRLTSMFFHPEWDAWILAKWAAKDVQCAPLLLHCIAGNPFAELPRCWWCLGDGQASHDEDYGACTVCGGSGHALAKSIMQWTDGTILKLAATIYDTRQWDLLPMLADAYSEAGGTLAAIDRHLRGYRLE